MRTIHRIIVSALIFSQDHKLLMGKKGPVKGGVFPDCWHLPGGGIDEGESMQQAVIREVREEVGIDIAPYTIEPIPYVDSGTSEKVLKDTGEKVLCHMQFNRFKVVIHDKTADEIVLQLDDDLIESRWFSLEELPHIHQVPGGKKFFDKIGYISQE